MVFFGSHVMRADNPNDNEITSSLNSDNVNTNVDIYSEEPQLIPIRIHSHISVVDEDITLNERSLNPLIHKSDGNKKNSFLPMSKKNKRKIERKEFKEFPHLNNAKITNSNKNFNTNSVIRQDSDETLSSFPRLIRRNLPHHQSKQNIKVVNGTSSSWMLSHDWFHMILLWPTLYSVLCLLTLWTAFILLFAIFYYTINHSSNNDCVLASSSKFTFSTAFAFSLETCTTVGYGLPFSSDAFFKTCPALQITIFFQMAGSMLFNAFLLAFFFARLARTERRSVQVLFSKNAIVEKTRQDGKWLFHVRVYDVSSHLPVVEAHVRMYCVAWSDYLNRANRKSTHVINKNNLNDSIRIQKDKLYPESPMRITDTTTPLTSLSPTFPSRYVNDEAQPQLLRTMRILQPDDDLGSMLFTSIPSTVTHHIDTYSPIIPTWCRHSANSASSHGLVLREVDQYPDEILDNISCPVCGTSYHTLENLTRHIEYTRRVEQESGYFPIKGSHRDPNLLPIEVNPKPTLNGTTRDDIRRYLTDKEIIVVVEGIEPMISGTFQALQSYTVDDVVFGGRYAPCMSQKDGSVFIDLDRFHDVIPPFDHTL